MIDSTSTYIAASVASLGLAMMILPMLYVIVRAAGASQVRRNIFTEVVVRQRPRQETVSMSPDINDINKMTVRPPYESSQLDFTGRAAELAKLGESPLIRRRGTYTCTRFYKI